jgi:CDP-2,3-bis-(O-geranylgeranyl)-sn-glycerol synthase
LDELPEALIPAVLLMAALDLSAAGVVIVVIAFALTDLLLTPVAGRLRRTIKRLR